MYNIDFLIKKKRKGRKSLKNVTISFGKEGRLNRQKKRDTNMFIKFFREFKEEQLKELKGAPLSVFICMAFYINDDGECWISNKRIIEETGYSKSTVIRAKKKLVEKGFIKKEEETLNAEILKKRYPQSYEQKIKQYKSSFGRTTTSTYKFFPENVETNDSGKNKEEEKDEILGTGRGYSQENGENNQTSQITIKQENSKGCQNDTGEGVKNVPGAGYKNDTRTRTRSNKNLEFKNKKRVCANNKKLLKMQDKLAKKLDYFDLGFKNEKLNILEVLDKLYNSSFVNEDDDKLFELFELSFEILNNPKKYQEYDINISQVEDMFSVDVLKEVEKVKKQTSQFRRELNHKFVSKFAQDLYIPRSEKYQSLVEDALDNGMYREVVLFALDNIPKYNNQYRPHSFQTVLNDWVNKDVQTLREAKLVAKTHNKKKMKNCNDYDLNCVKDTCSNENDCKIKSLVEKFNSLDECKVYALDYEIKTMLDKKIQNYNFEDLLKAIEKFPKTWYYKKAGNRDISSVFKSSKRLEKILNTKTSNVSKAGKKIDVDKFLEQNQKEAKKLKQSETEGENYDPFAQLEEEKNSQVDNKSQTDDKLGDSF